MNSAVLLLSNNPALCLKSVYCLSASGIPVDILSLRPGSFCRFSRHRRRFDEAVSEDEGTHLADLAAWIRERAPRHRWQAVLADDLHAHGVLHEIADRIPVPAFALMPEHALEALHDKWLFNQRLKAAGIDTPESWLLQEPQDLDHALASNLPFPLLVKPLNAESSHGIVRFDRSEPLRDYLTTPGPYKSFPLKLQRMIRGPTVGVSLLALDGRLLAHDVQLHTDDGSRVFYEDPQAFEAARRIVAEYGYGGPGHIDFVRETASGRLYALEFNCRFWYSTTVSMWRGGNFPALAVRVARGESIPAQPTAPGAYFQPGAVVRVATRRPWQLGKLDRRNWLGFWQAISDPLPHLLSRFA